MRLFSAGLAVAIALVMAGCSGSDDSDEPSAPEATPPSTVLDGAERGNAKGSTEEVPFDAGVADEGEQDSLDSPAIVQVPSDDGRQTSVAEVTIGSVSEGKVQGLQVDGVPKARTDEIGTYFVDYRMEYVNGPVLKNFQSAFLDLTSGGEIISADLVTYSGLADGCAQDYVVRAFGKGAVLEGCVLLLVAPDAPAPDGVAWSGQVEGAPDPQVIWPLS